MKQKMRMDWVIPVLEDIRDFLEENGKQGISSDVEAFLLKYRLELATLQNAGDAQPSIQDLPDNAIPLRRPQR